MFANKFNSDSFISQEELKKIIPLNPISTPFGDLDFFLFEKILKKDAHIFSLFQTRKHSILSRGFDILPPSVADYDSKIFHFVRDNMSRMASFQQDLYQILSAFEYGFSVMEIFYASYKGKICVDQLRFRHPSRFRFNYNLDLLWVDQDENIIKNCSKYAPNQFVVFRSGGNDTQPYGESLLTERIFWLFYYKKNIMDFLMSFIERFAHPIPVFRYPDNLSAQDHKALDDIMRNFHQELAAKIPKTVDFNFLEWKGDRASSLLHENILRWLNNEMSKAILGQTLTSDSPASSSSYAQSKVHENILHQVIQFDAARLESVINAQLIYPLVNFNFGYQEHYPQFKFRYKDDAKDWERIIQRDKILHDMGVRFPVSYFEKNYSLSGLSLHSNYLKDSLKQDISSKSSSAKVSNSLKQNSFTKASPSDLLKKDSSAKVSNSLKQNSFTKASPSDLLKKDSSAKSFD